MEKINIQSVVLLSDLKGYVVVEAQDVSAMFDAIQGIRHVRGQLRGELTYNEIDKYLIKKSTVSDTFRIIPVFVCVVNCDVFAFGKQTVKKTSQHMALK